MNMRCLLGFHKFSWKRILTTPPEQFIQSQTEANLGTCDYCKKQVLKYHDEEFNKED